MEWILSGCVTIEDHNENKISRRNPMQMEKD
jgi:hypothetical protein